MTIHEIYNHYNIMRNLQEHQLRVSAVAQLICISMTGVRVDTANIISACLLHDMGNLIKFKLELFPEFLKPKGLDYWSNVQRDFIEKYGTDEHEATIKIAEEILPKTYNVKRVTQEDIQKNPQNNKVRIVDILHSIGFSNGKKIAAYADMRVAPNCVTSMEARLDEGRRRFSTLKSYDTVFFEKMSGYLTKIENQIFSRCTIKPEDITEEKVRNIIPRLRSAFHTRSSDQTVSRLH